LLPTIKISNLVLHFAFNVKTKANGLNSWRKLTGNIAAQAYKLDIEKEEPANMGH
jgi:hypothetical protein